MIGLMMKMSKVEIIEKYLDKLFKDPKCELNYTKDYELLIAIVLSAQTTDKRVNSVTPMLFDKYDNLEKLMNADINNIESILRPLGSFRKKAVYVKEIARTLVIDYNGKVPTNRKNLEAMPGVGRKTCNVVLANLYDVPTIAVDTHVERVSKRLKLAYQKDSVWQVEQKLMRKFPKEKWSRLHHQLVLFGRYKCKALKPECKDCKLQDLCVYYKKR